MEAVSVEMSSTFIDRSWLVFLSRLSPRGGVVNVPDLHTIC